MRVKQGLVFNSTSDIIRAANDSRVAKSDYDDVSYAEMVKMRFALVKRVGGAEVAKPVR